jgi:hypothetical protein
MKRHYNFVLATIKSFHRLGIQILELSQKHYRTPRRTPGRCKGVFTATEESRIFCVEILRYAQNDTF